jgi:hypothetical protein
VRRRPLYVDNEDKNVKYGAISPCPRHLFLHVTLVWLGEGCFCSSYCYLDCLLSFFLWGRYHCSSVKAEWEERGLKLAWPWFPSITALWDLWGHIFMQMTTLLFPLKASVCNSEPFTFTQIALLPQGVPLVSVSTLKCYIAGLRVFLYQIQLPFR